MDEIFLICNNSLIWICNKYAYLRLWLRRWHLLFKQDVYYTHVISIYLMTTIIPGNCYFYWYKKLIFLNWLAQQKLFPRSFFPFKRNARINDFMFNFNISFFFYEWVTFSEIRVFTRSLCFKSKEETYCYGLL